MTNCFHGRSPGKTRKFGDLVEHDVVRAHEETVAKRLRQGHRRELGRRIDTLLDFSVTPSPRKSERSDIDDHAIGRSEKAKVEYALQKAKEYDSLREEITRYERALGFDFACTSKANDLEVQANHIMQELKKMDVEWFYKPAKPKIGYHGQEHTRFYGDHFLSNLDIIERTQLFALCRAMPKGAHLHIHFNANLLPNFLLDIAKDMEHMFIWSNIPLEDVSALNRCRIQFSIMSQDTAKSRGDGNLFEKTYQSQQVMRYKDFRSQFLHHYRDHVDVDTWLQTKLVFQEEEAHNMLQTAEG
jgi:adenosine deaminase CECR1